MPLFSTLSTGGRGPSKATRRRRRAPRGDILFTTPGTYTWTCPSNVFFVNAVCIGGGGGGVVYTSQARGGGGGGLGWKNNIPVVPGQTYTVSVGAGGSRSAINSNNATAGGDSFFINTSTVAGGGGRPGGYNVLLSTSRYTGYMIGGYFVGDGGGNGGAGGYGGSFAGGGGGAGGYTGDGGNAFIINTSTQAQSGLSGTGGGGGGGGACGSGGTAGAGGGVNLYGIGSSGLGGGGTTVDGYGGQGGSLGTDATFHLVATPVGNSNPNIYSTSFLSTPGLYGGGGAATDSGSNEVANGAGGAVRLVWGDGRAFPDSGVGFEENEALFTTPGSYTWTCPEGVTSVSVVCIGGGGAGDDGDLNNFTGAGGGGGGGGGGCAFINNITVFPGTSYNLTVGAGGNSQNIPTYNAAPPSGTASTITIGSIVLEARGGVGGLRRITGGGASGGDYAITNATGGTSRGGFSGGSGGPTADGGGGGGGAGGPGGTGGNGSNANAAFSQNGFGIGSGGGGGAGGNPGLGGVGGGAGGAGQYNVTGGGGGGAYIGGNFTTNGSPGNGLTTSGSRGGDGGFPGGGGGGSYRGGVGIPSAGGNGAIRIIWGANREFPNTNI